MIVKAGSMLYSIYVCLLISIFSGSLILLFSLNKEFSDRLFIKEQLIERCSSCLDFYLANPRSFEQNQTKSLNLFEDNLSCQFRTSKWGMLGILEVKAFFKNDKVEKNVFVGEHSRNDMPALVLANLGDQLKISGSTKINGDIYIPENGFKKINILGNSKLNKPVVNGKTKTSNPELPKLIDQIDSIGIDQSKLMSLSTIKSQLPFYRDFNEETTIVALQPGERLENLNLKGNIVLISADTLYVENSSVLEDIIIQAPKVIVADGFKGSLQIIAQKEVEVGKNVLFRYPSSLMVMSNPYIFNKRIVLSENSRIEGSIIIQGLSFDEKEDNEIIMEKNSIAIGDVYCNGKLEIKGSVFGSIYTHKLQMTTSHSYYSNLLLNATLDTKNLPSELIRLIRLERKEQQLYGVIKNL